MKTFLSFLCLVCLVGYAPAGNLRVAVGRTSGVGPSHVAVGGPFRGVTYNHHNFRGYDYNRTFFPSVGYAAETYAPMLATIQTMQTTYAAPLPTATYAAPAPTVTYAAPAVSYAAPVIYATPQIITLPYYSVGPVYNTGFYGGYGNGFRGLYGNGFRGFGHHR